MKFTLSKKQWEFLGKEAGWIESEKKKKKKPCWKGYEMVGTKEKDGKTVPNCVPKKASVEEKPTDEDTETNELKESLTDTFQANLKKINDCIDFLKSISNPNDLEGWILDKISSSADDIQDVCNYFDNYEDYIDVGESDSDEESMWCGEECSSDTDDEKGISLILAKKNKEKKVKLNKPFRTPGGPKKFSVYVKNDKGNVVKVNFGDPNMEIKRDDPDRKKSFRARHNCANPGPKWKPRYWSCKMWSSKKVSDLT